MKCSMMLHFIWVFNVCQSTYSGVSSIQRVNVLNDAWVFSHQNCTGFILINATRLFTHTWVRTLCLVSNFSISTSFLQTLHMIRYLEEAYWDCKWAKGPFVALALDCYKKSYFAPYH